MDASAEGAALRVVGTSHAQKFDKWLSEDLLREQYASASLDCAGAVQAAQFLVRKENLHTPEWQKTVSPKRA